MRVLVAASTGLRPARIALLLKDAGIVATARRPAVLDAGGLLDVDFVLVGDRDMEPPADLASRVWRMQRMFPETSVVAVVSDPDRVNVRALLAAGADAVVLQEEVATTLPSALTDVVKGQVSIPRGMWRSSAPAGLPPRQRQALGLAALGLTNSEIATRLHVSPRTVSKHLMLAFDRLGVHSRQEAADVLLGFSPDALAMSAATGSDSD